MQVRQVGIFSDLVPQTVELLGMVSEVLLGEPAGKRPVFAHSLHQALELAPARRDLLTRERFLHDVVTESPVALKLGLTEELVARRFVRERGVLGLVL